MKAGFILSSALSVFPCCLMGRAMRCYRFASDEDDE